MAKPRDYKKEYRRDHASAEAKKDRAARNKARRTLMRKGKVKKGDGREVHHKTALSKGGSNTSANWQVVSREANRKKATKQGRA